MAGNRGTGNRWLESADANRGEAYDRRFAEMASRGEDPHGEASLVEDLLRDAGGGSVLDAGCGTGRVAIELARRGFDVVGVDLDPAMLATARDKAPDLEWVEADLVDVALGRAFDVVLAAGNVMIFLTPGTEAAAVANLTLHLRVGGLLVAGFSVLPGRLALDAYDALAADAGLVLRDRWATWQRDPYTGGDYAVSVHVAG